MTYQRSLERNDTYVEIKYIIYLLKKRERKEKTRIL